MSHLISLSLKANDQEIEGARADGTTECLDFRYTKRREIGKRGLPGGYPHVLLQLNKRIDKISPLLAKALENAEHVEGKFEFRRPDPTGDGTVEHFLTIEFKKARVVGVLLESKSAFGSTTSEAPFEGIQIVAGEVTCRWEPTGAMHVSEHFR